MIISTATLDALRTTVSLVYRQAYDATQPWYTELATEISSSGKSNTYGWIARQTRLRKWLGARVVQNLSEHAYVLENSPFEGTIEIDKHDVEDDNLGIYTAIDIPELALAAKKHPDQLIAALLMSNPKCFDGKNFFASDHPTFAKPGTGAPAAYGNDYTLDLTPDNFNTIWSAQSALVGEDGQPLGALPNRLVCAPQNRKNAEEITKAGSIVKTIMNVAKNQNVAAAAVDNVLKGWAEPLILPELALMPNTWFLACTTRAIKPFVRQLRTPYSFAARFDPTDPKVFDEHMFTFGCEGRGTVGVTLPFLMARSVPAGDTAPTIDPQYMP